MGARYGQCFLAYFAMDSGALPGYDFMVIIFLYGSDSYRRIQKFKELYASYKSKNTSLDALDVDCALDQDAWIRVRDFLAQPSMFTSTKLVLVREPLEVEGKEWLKVLREHIDSKTTFIIASDSHDKPTARFKFLTEAPVRAQAFHELDGTELLTFLKKEATIRGAALSRDAWRVLVTQSQASAARTWFCVSVIEQCALLKREVTPEDIQSITSWKSESDVFRESRAITGNPSIRDRLRALEKLILGGAAPAHIFNSLAFSSRGPALTHLADLDVALKGGGVEYEEALLDIAIY